MYMKEEDWLSYRSYEERCERTTKIVVAIIVSVLLIVFGAIIAYRIHNPAPAAPASVMQKVGTTVVVDGVEYHAKQFITTSGTARDVHFVVNTITNELKVVWETGTTIFNEQQHSENTGLLYNAPTTD